MTGANRAAEDYHDHYSFDLAGNRLRKTTDLGNDGSIEDEIDSAYDANDRLLNEQLSHPLPASVQGPVEVSRSTTYGYDHTQQIGKTVYNGADLNNSTKIASSMHFAYDLQGRQSVATNSTFNGSDGTRLTAERTTYGYDATGGYDQRHRAIDRSCRVPQRPAELHRLQPSPPRDAPGRDRPPHQDCRVHFRSRRNQPDDADL